MYKSLCSELCREHRRPPHDHKKLTCQWMRSEGKWSQRIKVMCIKGVATGYLQLKKYRERTDYMDIKFLFVSGSWLWRGKKNEWCLYRWITQLSWDVAIQVTVESYKCPSSSFKVKRENNVQCVQIRNKRTHSFRVLYNLSDQQYTCHSVLVLCCGTWLQGDARSCRANIDQMLLCARHCHRNFDVFYLKPSSQPSYK